MTKPPYAVVRRCYPTRDRFPRQKLLTDVLGWDDLLDNHSFDDTCAMRMSAALALSGVKLIGARMKGNGGTAKGKLIEPGQGRLSHIRRRMWGKPVTYRSELEAREGIGQRSGVVSFFRIHPGSASAQGHIDLVEPRTNGFSECATQCCFKAQESGFGH